MTPEPDKTNWADINNVFALLETDGRTLSAGEKKVIAGQRRINGILFETMEALLKTFPADSAHPALTQARDLLKDLPGKEPPGCKTSCELDPGHPITDDCVPGAHQ